MWKNDSWNWMKNNRSSCISVMAVAFISALLLSVMCSLFYQFWIYEIQRIQKEEGDWQSRITGEISEEDQIKIQNYASVRNVRIHKEKPESREITADIYFNRMRDVLTDTQEIAEMLGYGPDNISYHDSLLSLYLIRNPDDPAPRAVFPLLLGVTVMACFSLIMIIHHSFAVSMNAKIRRFGILSTIGATPRQIRAFLLQEAFALCAVPVLAGNLLGIAASKGVIDCTNRIVPETAGRIEAAWHYHPLLLMVTVVLTMMAIWISAWIPARRISRMSPLGALKHTTELTPRRKRNACALGYLFGIEGQLAGNAVNAQGRNLRTASISLTVSFLAFFLMQCFFTLTGISQEMTYFERYQDAWDVMVTIKHTEIDEFGRTDDLQKLSLAESCTVYQKAMAKRAIAKEEFSQAFDEADGLQDADRTYVSVLEDGWRVNAPVVILDDSSFLQYCKQLGAEPRLDGAVIFNRINSDLSPNFRIRKYIPYLDENLETTVLERAGEETKEERPRAEIPVLAYGQEPPVLREAYDEYDRYVLVHILPVSLWKEIKGQVGGVEENTYIRILAKEATPEHLARLEEACLNLLGTGYETESENRIQEKETNDAMIRGMMLVLGGFCFLLAVIGISNVFSYTLGFVQQRRRELARYLSVGMTPGGMKKMFCIEALIIAGRPVLTALMLNGVLTGLMIRAAYLKPAVFLGRMPVMPVLLDILAVFAAVALAYYLGGRKVMQSSLASLLRNDVMI